MRSGRRILHWDTPMPGHVHRHHEDPRTSDNYGAIRRAAAEQVGSDDIRTNDCNGQWYYCRRLGRWICSGGHWHEPDRNGYTRIKRRLLPGTRKMNRRERNRRDWDWDQVRRCRRPNGERPRMIEELYTYGVLHGVVQIVEEKHPKFGAASLVGDLVAAARRHDHPAWFMVLDDMAPREKVAATRQAGGQIALIFGRDGVDRPHDWASWLAYPNQVWGPDYAKRWLP